MTSSRYEEERDVTAIKKESFSCKTKFTLIVICQEEARTNSEHDKCEWVLTRVLGIR